MTINFDLCHTHFSIFWYICFTEFINRNEKFVWFLKFWYKMNSIWSQNQFKSLLFIISKGFSKFLAMTQNPVNTYCNGSLNGPSRFYRLLSSIWLFWIDTEITWMRINIHLVKFGRKTVSIIFKSVKYIITVSEWIHYTCLYQLMHLMRYLDTVFL